VARLEPRAQAGAHLQADEREQARAAPAVKGVERLVGPGARLAQHLRAGFHAALSLGGLCPPNPPARSLAALALTASGEWAFALERRCRPCRQEGIMATFSRLCGGM